METNAFKNDCGWIDSILTADRYENDHSELTSNLLPRVCRNEVNSVHTHTENMEFSHVTDNPQNQELTLFKNPNVDFNSYVTGLFKCCEEQKGFGFITTEKYGDVYCNETILLKLKKGDLVLFRLVPSKRLLGKYIAKNVQSAFLSEDNSIVAQRQKSQISDLVVEFLPLVLKKIQCKERESFFEEIIFDYPIGNANCVEVSNRDTIFYAKRKGGSANYLKYVKYRLPQLSDTVTVIIKKKQHYYEIVDAYFGEKTEPMPLDKKATPQSVGFWDKHALVYNPEEVATFSETMICPWHKGHTFRFLNFIKLVYNGCNSLISMCISKIQHSTKSLLRIHNRWSYSRSV
ncbi:MAG: hypothetical protein ACOYN5_01395 [Bacteroidales bacterium]